MAGMSAGLSSAEGMVLPALSSLFKPSIAPNNPPLAGQMKLLGLNSPSQLAPGQDTSGMFGPSLASQSATPMMLGGMGLSMLPGSIPKTIGAGMGGLGTLALLAGLL